MSKAFYYYWFGWIWHEFEHELLFIFRELTRKNEKLQNKIDATSFTHNKRRKTVSENASGTSQSFDTSVVFRDTEKEDSIKEEEDLPPNIKLEPISQSSERIYLIKETSPILRRRVPEKSIIIPETEENIIENSPIEKIKWISKKSPKKTKQQFHKIIPSDAKKAVRSAPKNNTPIHYLIKSPSTPIIKRNLKQRSILDFSNAQENSKASKSKSKVTVPDINQTYCEDLENNFTKPKSVKKNILSR